MYDLQKDRDAIVDRYALTVWRVALSRTRREDAAQEVFQDVFLRLFEKERDFEDEEHLKAWLIRTTIVCCRRYLSAFFGSQTLSLDELGERCNAEALPDDAHELYEAILRLPAIYRIPIVLYYIEELPTEQCLQVLHMKPTTFRSRLQRGRLLLKKALKGEDHLV